MKPQTIEQLRTIPAETTEELRQFRADALAMLNTVESAVYALDANIDAQRVRRALRQLYRLIGLNVTWSETRWVKKGDSRE